MEEDSSQSSWTEDVTVNVDKAEDTSATAAETTTAATTTITEQEEEEELALLLPSSDGYCYTEDEDEEDCCTSTTLMSSSSTTSTTERRRRGDSEHDDEVDRYFSVSPNNTPSERDELLRMECGSGSGRRSFGNEQEEEDDDDEEQKEEYIDASLSSSSSSSSLLPAYCGSRGMNTTSWKNRTTTGFLCVVVVVLVVILSIHTQTNNSNNDNVLDSTEQQQQAQAQAQIFRGPPSPTKITRPTEGEIATFTSNNKNSDDYTPKDQQDNLEEEYGYAGDDLHSSSSKVASSSNKFFDTVLPWKKNQRNKKKKNNRISKDTNSGTDDEDDDDDDDDTVWYEGALEFCSNEDGTSYAYGLPGRCIPGSPAPLIRIYPKHHYRLTLINTADIDTNLHTHGLHISGVGNVDDVTRNVQPGHCLVYEYYLLEDSDVGTFWYHPHRHPLVSRSAYGGAYGLLLVDENPFVLSKYYPPHLQNFLSRNADNEILLQFSSMLSPDKKHRYNRINGLESSSFPDLISTKSNQTSSLASTPPPLTIAIKPDTHYRVRISAVVYSDAVNYLEFLRHDACDFISPVAYDGVYRSEIPHPNNNSPKHMLTVSSRLDVALRCQKDVDIYFHQGQKDLVQNAEILQMVHVHVVSEVGKVEEKNTVKPTTGKVVDLTNPFYPTSPFWDDKKETTWSPRRPYYMPDLTNEYQVGQSWIDDTWTVSMDDYFTNGTKAVSVNQVVWDPSVAARSFDLNALVEWNLLRTQTHPFHAHINRMQIVQPGGCGHRYEEGQYFDTVTANIDECLVRMKFFDYAGRIVIHCHRFGHEDRGMMTWIDVLGGHGHGVKAEPQVDCPALP